MSMFIIV